MKNDVTISRTALASLLSDALRYRQAQDFFRRLIGDTIEPRSEDLPNGIDWESLDSNNAVKEAQKALQTLPRGGKE